ncbi:MAG TPA: hypothetical protein VIJ16_10830, partial [Gemmatimonadaceae bacterium]
SACRNAAIPFAGSAPGGPDRVQQAFTALYERYANVHHGPKYNYARTHLSSAALIPSHVFNDTAVWTAEPDSTIRELQIGEHVTAGATEQEAAIAVPLPSRLGDARHLIRLRKLPNGDYAWDTDVEIALGTIPARDVADGIGALLTSAGTRSDAELRADYTAAFPRTTAVMSELFSMDTLRTARQSDGSSLVTMYFTLHPEGLRARYPAFAAYMQKYVNGTRYDLRIADHSGAVFFSASAGSPQVVVRARVRGHEFIPLDGPPHVLPDSLVIAGTFTTKIKIFTIGMKQFTSDFVIARSEHERSWTFHFGQEPKWKLPLATAHLLQSPLRRPFQGAGITYRLAVRDSAGAQTVLIRQSHSEVHESPIMHFIGSLISHVVTELGGQIQDEQFHYMARVFDAMRQDFGALLPPK